MHIETVSFLECLSMYDCCMDAPILLINRIVHKELMCMQLNLAYAGCARLHVYAVVVKNYSSISERFASFMHARELNTT